MKRIRKSYEEYDYDNSFDDISKLDEDQKKRLLEAGKVSWIYAVKKIKSGRIDEIEIYPEFTRAQLKKHPEIKKHTRASQRNLNEKNAKKKLDRLINANFKSGDLWVTLTYDDDHLPATMNEAVKKMNYYIKKLNRFRKKKGLENARYIYVTELGSGRVHHHLIMDGDLSMDDVERLWPYGRRNNTRRIAEDSNGLAGLSKYISKEGRGKNEKRWNSSKNLKKPKETKNHQISAKKVRSLKDDGELESYAEKIYPARKIIEVRRCFNEKNGLWYFYVKVGGDRDKGRNERKAE